MFLVTYRRRGSAHRASRTFFNRAEAWSLFMALGRDPRFIGVNFKVLA